MSISETLYVQGADLRELVNTFFNGIGVPPDFHSHPSQHKLLEFAKGPGFSVDAIRIVEPASYVQFLTDTLGFTPTAKLVIFYDPHSLQEATRCLLLRATLSLVQNTPWNIALRLHDAKTVLLLTNGALRLNNQAEVWTPQHLKTLVSPFTVAELNQQVVSV